MSTRIALEIAAELDLEDCVVCREASAVIRAQHSEIEWMTAERDAAIAAAVAAERESCAKIADRGTNPMPATNTDRYLPGAKEASALTASAIAKAIRARAVP